MHFSNEPTGRAIIVHNACGISVDAHFFFQSTAGNRVAVTEGAVLVDKELRYDKERDAFDAFGAAGDFGQYKVDDVVDQVVFSTRDPDFLARNFVASVVLRLGFCPHQPKICAAVWFSQVHRSRPFARVELWQVGCFLLVGAVCM